MLVDRLQKHACTSQGLRRLVMKKHAGLGRAIGRGAAWAGKKITTTTLANPGNTLLGVSTGLGAFGAARKVSSSMNDSLLRQNVGMPPRNLWATR